MPIILDDLQNSTPAVKTYDPKFFSKKLTGRGGTSAGRLSAKNNPVMIDPKVQTSHTNAKVFKSENKNGYTTITQIPLNPIAHETYDYMDEMTIPDLTDMVLIGNINKNELYMFMTINAIILEETSAPANTLSGGKPVQNGCKITTNYQIFFYKIVDKNNKKAKKLNNHYRQLTSKDNTFLFEYSDNPMLDCMTDIYQKLTTYGYKLNAHVMQDYIQNFDLYTAVVKRSEQWQTSIDVILDEVFENIAYTLNHAANYNLRTKKQIIGQAYYQVKYIMNYNIPLDLYRNIYKSICNHFTPDDAHAICKQNLNLMLSDTMNDLNNNKAQIVSFTTPQNVAIPQSVQKLSPEQHKAVTSTEPLILVQAGAGTGKSTLILGRIDYLTACGVNPNDITVLSFTNAAADHITDKNPNIHSMTIARMIHEIYSTNFKNHELSSLDTIYNSIDIYFPSTPQAQRTVPQEFRSHIYCLNNISKHPNAFTEMNNFIEEHYDEVISILNTIKQTSLELEIMICYQQIETFKEPLSVTSKFLIIDEVQDNSIFEFIYTLKYIDKHKESLFIVGDCSQTLYEFRASNPRALNILEGSNTFATYQLNVNYRSNQEILDFANIALQNIEANQYANIQLQANSLAKVTEQSFLDRVFFNYHRLPKMKDFHDSLPHIISNEIKPYIDHCLAKGEQVAFLSYPRSDIMLLQEILEAQYPKHKTISLVPDKMYNMTVMSNYIKRHWHELKFVPTQSIMDVIKAEIMARLSNLVYNDAKAAPAVQKMLYKWQSEQGPAINAWTNQVNSGQITMNQFLTLVKENMLQFEIRHNAIKQSLLSAKNQANKTTDRVQNANFLLSTIHSAKGLEFDNVVVLYKNQNNLDEASKRMYYVAFTRAMKSEYVLAYDTTASPQIEADYMTVLKKLHDYAPSPNSPLNVPSKNKRIKI